MSEVVGCVLAVAAGASVALSMVMQRYALTYPDQKHVPLLCVKWPANWVWIVALVVYGIGTGALYSVAGLFISLSLLSALFATLLIFNLWFARRFLNEKWTPNRVIGAVGILIGTTLCVIGRAQGVPTEYTPDEVADMFASAKGAAYFSTLCALVIGSVVAIIIVRAIVARVY